MINGLIVLGGLCAIQLIMAKEATKGENTAAMDFYEFYDLDKPEKEMNSASIPLEEPVPKLQLRVIKGGKASS